MRMEKRPSLIRDDGFKRFAYARVETANAVWQPAPVQGQRFPVWHQE